MKLSEFKVGDRVMSVVGAKTVKCIHEDRLYLDHTGGAHCEEHDSYFACWEGGDGHVAMRQPASGHLQLIERPEKQWKVGDIYPDWEKLTPLPDGPNLSFKKGDLFVILRDLGIYAIQGQIISLSSNDGSVNPFFSLENNTGRFCARLSWCAPLPPQAIPPTNLTPSTTLKIYDDIGPLSEKSLNACLTWMEKPKPTSVPFISSFSSSMSSLLQKLRDGYNSLTEPSKTLQRAGLETKSGEMTDAAKELTFERIRNEWWSLNKEKIAEEFRKLEEEEKAKD